MPQVNWYKCIKYSTSKSIKFESFVFAEKPRSLASSPKKTLAAFKNHRKRLRDRYLYIINGFKLSFIEDNEKINKAELDYIKKH